jgi:hypothetical protein
MPLILVMTPDVIRYGHPVRGEGSLGDDTKGVAPAMPVP